MSMPNIPDIDAKIRIDLEDTIALLIASVALEEIGISHILNAEGEKIQKATKLACTVRELVKVNSGVNDLLYTITHKEDTLLRKLEIAEKLMEQKRRRKCD